MQQCHIEIVMMGDFETWLTDVQFWKVSISLFHSPEISSLARYEMTKTQGAFIKRKIK